jgi:hypothetical protein
MMVGVDSPGQAGQPDMDERRSTMKDDKGREGLSSGGIAKELEVSPGAVRKALQALGLSAPDFVKAGCGYYYADRLPEIRKALP